MFVVLTYLAVCFLFSCPFSSLFLPFFLPHHPPLPHKEFSPRKNCFLVLVFYEIDIFERNRTVTPQDIFLFVFSYSWVLPYRFLLHMDGLIIIKLMPCPWGTGSGVTKSTSVLVTICSSARIIWTFLFLYTLCVRVYVVMLLVCLYDGTTLF